MTDVTLGTLHAGVVSVLPTGAELLISVPGSGGRNLGAATPAAVLGARTALGGLTATGTTQGTAYPLTVDDSVFTTVPVGSGVILRAIAGFQRVLNRGANPQKVYPPVGGTIEGNGVNTAVPIPPGGAALYFSTDSGVTFYAV